MVDGEYLVAAALPSVKTRYPLYKRLGGPRAGLNVCEKSRSPTGIQSPDRPARSESLYRPLCISSSSITAMEMPWGFQEFEAPRFHDSQNMKVIRLCQPYAPTAFIPRKYSWLSFLLEAESIPGP